MREKTSGEIIKEFNKRLTRNGWEVLSETEKRNISNCFRYIHPANNSAVLDTHEVKGGELALGADWLKNDLVIYIETTLHVYQARLNVEPEKYLLGPVGQRALILEPSLFSGDWFYNTPIKMNIGLDIEDLESENNYIKVSVSIETRSEKRYAYLKEGEIDDYQLKKKELNYSIPRKDLKEFLGKLINTCCDRVRDYLESFKKMKYVSDYNEAIDEIRQKLTKRYGDIIEIDYDSDDFNHFSFEYNANALDYDKEELIEWLFEEKLSEYDL